MVKSQPRLQNRQQRKKWRLQRKLQLQLQVQDQTQTLTPKPLRTTPSPSLKRRLPSPTSSLSFSPSSFSSPTKISLSSPESPNPTSNPTTPDPPSTRSLTGNGSFSDPVKPKCPELPPIARSISGQFPPLPPPPSKQLLRRTVSDPVPFGSFTPPPKHQMGSSDAPRNLLPSSSSPGSGSASNTEKDRSSKRLRRMSKKMKKAVGENDPGSAPQCTNICSKNDEDTTSNTDEKGKARERAVEAERLSGDRIMIKVSCECGSVYQFLFNEAENKCYYKLV